MKKTPLAVRFLQYWQPGKAERQCIAEILSCFSEEFPISNFSWWDTEIDDKWARQYFAKYKDHSAIDLLWLIVDLSKIGKPPPHPYISARGASEQPGIAGRTRNN